ncbi:MAG: hypothetical protein PF505_13525 [Vallitaleaceae bacterium]|jgi:hypothetical protein|nr:hypothetical protein [Vallitaleaceae bacterium]
MINQEKVKLMTKIAAYEQNKGKADKTMMTYFKNDFISFRGFSVQIGVTVALLILFGGDFAINVIDNLAKITEFDFVGTGIKYLTIWVFFMLAYTVVSAFYNRIEYLKSENRVNNYQKMLKQLEKIDS